jgi:hypothetical protein
MSDPTGLTLETTDWDKPEPVTLDKVREWRAEADKLLWETMEGPYSVIVALADYILAIPAGAAEVEGLDELDKWDALVSKVTQRPWSVHIHNAETFGDDVAHVSGAHGCAFLMAHAGAQNINPGREHYVSRSEAENAATFIVALVNAYPQLRALLTRQAAEIERLGKERDEAAAMLRQLEQPHLPSWSDEAKADAIACEKKHGIRVVSQEFYAAAFRKAGMALNELEAAEAEASRLRAKVEEAAKAFDNIAGGTSNGSLAEHAGHIEAYAKARAAWLRASLDASHAAINALAAIPPSQFVASSRSPSPKEGDA